MALNNRETIEHFFERETDQGKKITIVDENKFYEKNCLIKNGIYYHHSIPSDNPWLPWQYLRRLDDLKNYDYPLYMVARWGRFGASGTRVFPQFTVATKQMNFKERVQALGIENQYFGFDFGFEESYNCVLSMSVDVQESILYIWDEIYVNHLTDPQMARRPDMQKLKDRLDNYYQMGYNKIIVADNEDPKAIQYYRQQGFYMRPCRCKFNNSRISNTRKVKRFYQIIVSPKCVNTWRELETLSYKKDKNGNTVPDEFNIDPHSFSAIWYALDEITLADVKLRKFNTKDGRDIIHSPHKLKSLRYGGLQHPHHILKGLLIHYLAAL